MKPLPFHKPHLPPDDDEPAEALMVRLLRKLAGHSLAFRLGDLILDVSVRQAAAADVLGPSGASKLSKVERDAIEVLAAAKGRMTGAEIEAALARKGIEWATATLHRALARLVRLGFLQNNKRSPQGYVLAARPGASQP